jgi:hypothetical protein
VPLAEVLGEDLRAAAGHPVDARVAQAGSRLSVREPGAVGQEHELRDRQRIELDPLAVPLAHGREQVAVVVEWQLRVEAAVESDEVAAGLEQLVDLREDVLSREHVAPRLVREDVERAVVALGDADVRVVDDPHDHVGRVVRPVPDRPRLGGEPPQLLVVAAQPELARLVDRDPRHTGTRAESTSMNDDTENTAFPAPGSP